MKVLIVLLGLVLASACDGVENTENIVAEKTDYTYEDYLEAQKLDNSDKELKEMQELFKNCKYGLINVEQSVIHGKVDKIFNNMLATKGEDNTDQNHYIITVQYDGTRNDWINSWIGNSDNKDSVFQCTNRVKSGRRGSRCTDGYFTEREDWVYIYDDYYSSTGDYADMFESLFGLHALQDVSGIYMKPSMEIIVVDTDGEVIYSVFNGDFKDKVSDWATDEQLEYIYRSGQVDIPFNRDWKEFVLGE